MSSHEIVQKKFEVAKLLRNIMINDPIWVSNSDDSENNVQSETSDSSSGDEFYIHVEVSRN